MGCAQSYDSLASALEVVHDTMAIIDSWKHDSFLVVYAWANSVPVIGRPGAEAFVYPYSSLDNGGIGDITIYINQRVVSSSIYLHELSHIARAPDTNDLPITQVSKPEDMPKSGHFYDDFLTSSNYKGRLSYLLLDVYQPLSRATGFENNLRGLLQMIDCCSIRNAFE